MYFYQIQTNYKYFQDFKLTEILSQHTTQQKEKKKKDKEVNASLHFENFKWLKHKIRKSQKSINARGIPHTYPYKTKQTNVQTLKSIGIFQCGPLSEMPFPLKCCDNMSSYRDKYQIWVCMNCTKLIFRASIKCNIFREILFCKIY